MCYCIVALLQLSQTYRPRRTPFTPWVNPDVAIRSHLQLPCQPLHQGFQGFFLHLAFKYRLLYPHPNPFQEVSA